MTTLTPRQVEYRESYLRSWHWYQMRILALEDADHRCSVCNATKHLDVHHRTYERIGNERLTDLLVLCRTCHDIFHQHSRLAAKPKTTSGPGSKGTKKRTKKNLASTRPKKRLPRSPRAREKIESVLGQQPATTKDLAVAAGLSWDEAGYALDRMRSLGVVRRRPDKRWERTDAPRSEEPRPGLVRDWIDREAQEQLRSKK